MVRLFTSSVEDCAPFCTFVSYGVVGVLIDLDHLFALFISDVDGRAWHPALCVLCWFSFCGVIAFITGLLVKLVLKKMRVHLNNSRFKF